MKLPYISLSAKNHFDFGYQLGKKLKQKIQQSVARKLDSINQSALKNKIQESRKYLFAARQYYPQYVKELEGISEGTLIHFDKLFLINCREVYDESDLQRCTTVAVKSEKGYLIGHNEDWEENGEQDIYLFKVNLNGTTIFGLNYYSEIIGNSICMNSYGLLQAINDLAHTNKKVGVPKNFIARDILSKKTINEVISVFSYCPRASGFNHIILTKDEVLFNIESTAEEIQVNEITNRKYIHTNHFLSKKLKQYDCWSNNRTHIRHDRAKRLINSVKTVSNLKSLLRNDEGYPMSIMNNETNASIIVDMKNKTVEVAAGNNLNNKFYNYKLDLN